MAQTVCFHLAWASLNFARRAITLQKCEHILFVRCFQDIQFLLSVRQFVQHKAFDVAQTFYHFFLHLSRFEFIYNSIDVKIFPLKVFLLHDKQLGLLRLLFLLLDRGRSLFFGTLLA